MKAKYGFAFAWAMASVGVASAQPLPPPMAPVARPLPDTSIDQRGLDAAALWAGGDPQVVAKAYEKLGLKPSATQWVNDGRRVMVDWLMALSWSDPTKAATLLSEWKASDPLTNDGVWTIRRMLVETQILLRQANLAEAKRVASQARRLLDQEKARKAAEIEALPKKQRWRAESVRDSWLQQVGPIVRRAEFLVAAYQPDQWGFSGFSEASSNPFVDGTGSLFIQMGEPISCPQHDLDDTDWAIFDVSLVRGEANKPNRVFVRPFAASRFEMFKPYLAKSKDWSVTVKNGIGDQARKAVFVRCLRTTRPVAEKLPDVDYLFTYLKPMIKELPADYRFDKFRQPVSDIARDGAWGWVTNIAMSPDPTVPGIQRDAQRVLLDMLKAKEKPDPVAIAIAEHIALPDAEAGRVGQLKYRLPDRVAFVQRVRGEGKLPPRVLSEFELQLAKRHESNGEVLAATTLYKAIVARDHAAGVPRVAEQIKASLRLAAIASAAGRKQESDAIFAELGLSPDQCSVYQSKPAMLSFRHPEYSGAMLRAESEGRVQFEFDLDSAGAPSNLRVTQSSPPFLFDKKTLDSFAAAKFAPVTNGTDALACKGAEQAFMWKMPGL
jgi:hypothetical protein